MYIRSSVEAFEQIDRIAGRSGYELIFKTGEILPQPGGMGGIEWQPMKFGNTTIDVPDIKKRFDAFGIATD